MRTGNGKDHDRRIDVYFARKNLEPKVNSKNTGDLFLDLKINDYILLNFILFIYLLFLTGPQGQQCYTLMGFSILYKNSLLLLLLLLL